MRANVARLMRYPKLQAYNLNGLFSCFFCAYALQYLIAPNSGYENVNSYWEKISNDTAKILIFSQNRLFIMLTLYFDLFVEKNK